MRTLAPAVAAIALLIALSTAAFAESREQYVRQVGQVLSTVQRAERASGRTRDDLAARALEDARRLGRTPVDTAAGPVRPYLGQVERALSASPPDLDAADAYLRDVLAGVGGSEYRPVELSQARALREVLSDPRFRPSPAGSWLDQQLGKLGRWIAEQLRKILPGGISVPVSNAALSLPQVVVIVAAVLLVAVVIAFVTRGYSRAARDRKLSDQEALERTATPAEMIAAAAEHARKGDYRMAVRAQFVALLLTLHERGEIRYNRSLTNREHLRNIGRGTPLRAALEPVVSTFDDVWYGNVPIGREGYEAYRERTSKVLAGVPG